MGGACLDLFALNVSTDFASKFGCNLLHRLKNGVDEVTILEPNDKEIVSHDIDSDNIYQRIVSVMKQSTQEYYNMRMILNLETI